MQYVRIAIYSVLGFGVVLTLAVLFLRRRPDITAKYFPGQGYLFWVYLVLRLIVLFTMIRQIMIGNYNGAFICLLSEMLFFLPQIVKKKMDIEIPRFFEAAICLFIFASQILGEVNHFYIHIPGWDTILHTINGFLCAAIGFSTVDILNRSSKNIKLSPAYLALVSFCFSMTIGVLWEFIEFTGDMLFGLDAQKDFIIHSFQSVSLDSTQTQQAIPVREITRTIIEQVDGNTVIIEEGYLDIGLMDTMKDLLVNFLGAVVYSIGGYFYAKNSEKKKGVLATIAGELRIRPKH